MKRFTVCTTLAALIALCATLAVSQTRPLSPIAPIKIAVPTSSSISGTVTAGGSTIGVANVKVTVSGSSLTATTSSTGAYSIANVSFGSRTLTFTSSQYQSYSVKVMVPIHGALTVNASMLAAIAGPGATIPWNGQDWYLFGANYPWQNYGTDFGTGGWGKYTDWTSIASDFATMHSQGVNVVRWWVFGDARYDPDFNADGTISGIDSQFLPNIDQALEIANANDIYLILQVLDNSVCNAADVVSGVQLGGHAAIITTSTVQQSYLDNALKPLLQHIAASPYRNNVIAYDVINEPEAQMAAFWGGQNFSTASVQQ